MFELHVDIPNHADWETKPLGKICSELRRGNAPVYVEESNVKAIGQRCVTHTDFDPGAARPHSEKSMTGVLVASNGDVLLNSTGTGTIGRSCVYAADGTFVVDGHVTVLRPAAGQADSRWLNALIRSTWFQTHMERFCYTGSTNQLELSRVQLTSSSVPVPSALEQAAIGDIIDTLDTQIRQTEAIIAKLQQVKKGLLHDLLTRGINEHGQLRLTREQAPELYKESPLGWIPKEWSLVSLNDVAEVDRGKFTHRPRNDPRFYGGNHPFIQTGDVVASGGDFLTTFSQSLSDLGVNVSREFPAGTIAVTIAANIADTGILGRPMYFPDSIVAVVVKPEISVRYIELVIRSAKRTLDAKAPQSAQKNINLQDLRPLPVPLPDHKEQGWLAERYEVFVQRLNHEIDTVQKLKKQKAGLMDDLLTGRVRVTELIEQAQQAS